MLVSQFIKIGLAFFIDSSQITFYFSCFFCVFNISNTPFYIVYKIEMKDKKYGTNLIIII